jgi:UDP-2-acetamido-3-amino-2,3-dideoxy-glucuronate N-acetyltransferase
MLGVPARQVGWMSRFGKRLALPLTGQTEVICPNTGDRYLLEGDRLRLDTEGKADQSPP